MSQAAASRGSRLPLFVLMLAFALASVLVAVRMR